MTPAGIRENVVAERVSWIRRMLQGLRDLPLDSEKSFQEDPRTPAAAESYLRRALEALFDLGRHVLAKGLGVAAVEYKQIAVQLAANGILCDEDSRLMRDMAGYRNRMVHFYDEVGTAELYQLARNATGDLERLLAVILEWIAGNPERVDSR